MNIVSACPLHVGSIVWQPRPGAWVATVVVKATYVLLPGESVLAREQDPINDTDAHWNDDERRSLHAATDLAPLKRRADVFVTGHAHAPRAKPVSSLVARLAVGALHKAIEVHADRVWGHDGQVREGAPFQRMPLRWERAGGGPETSNPVGIRSDARDRHGQWTLPNLQPPGFRPSRPGEPFPPVGFGPVAPRWPERVAKLFQRAATWSHERWMEQPLPPDIDAAFFNAAPLDQQLPELAGDERLLLEHLHAEHPQLRTALPGLAPRATVERSGAAPQELPLRCDTLDVDTDRGLCHLVWRGLLPLSWRDEVGRVVITADKTGPVPEVGRPLGQAASARDFPIDDEPTALPFEDTGPVRVGPKSSWGALPFKSGTDKPPEGAPAQPGHRAAGSLSASGTLLPGTVLVPKEPLPFGRAERNEAPPEVLQPPPYAQVPSFGLPPLAPVAAPPVVTPPPVVAPPIVAPPVVPPIVAPPIVPPIVAPPPVVAPPVAPPPVVPPPVVPPPPPRIGPLAREVVEEDTAQGVPTPPIDSPPAEVIVPVPPEEPLAALSIERFSAIAAEIAEKRDPKAEVLCKNDLTESDWTANEQLWTKALEDERARGSSRLRAASDRAYVEAVEGFRGPITLADHARITLGLERGQVNPVLDELRIQRPALMRIIRLWTKKIAADMKLSEEARALLASLRAGRATL